MSVVVDRSDEDVQCFTIITIYMHYKLYDFLAYDELGNEQTKKRIQY